MKEQVRQKILLMDLETAPNIGYTWGRWEQNVIEFLSEDYLLCYAYKWLGQKKVTAVKHKNNKSLVQALWKLFDEADVIIAHNGDQFDIKKSNAYFLRHGLPPPSPYKTVDTKKVAKRYFRFNSNKLDDLGTILGLGRKMQTGGFDLWKGCMSDDKKSWSKMLRYNKQDVVLLEKVYLKLLPWMTNHPDVGGHGQCKNCRSSDLHKRGFAVNSKCKYQRLQCQGCGAWSQQKHKKNGRQ